MSRLLFYHGRSSERFLKALEKLADQEKSTPLRRWYLAEPDIEDKKKVRVSNTVFPEGLEDFLTCVRNRVNDLNGSPGKSQSVGS